MAEVSQFLFGEGFAITGGEQWRVRRKAVGPALHRCGMEIWFGCWSARPAIGTMAPFVLPDC